MTDKKMTDKEMALVGEFRTGRRQTRHALYELAFENTTVAKLYNYARTATMFLEEILIALEDEKAETQKAEKAQANCKD